MEQLFWLGNVAKTRVIATIIQLARERDTLSVIDFGCGDGGDWPRILEQHSSIHLTAIEPDAEVGRVAAERLRPFDADVVVGTDPLPIEADVIISFSVLEHVWNRTEYLSTARTMLAPDGVFFLNYDDGHFREGVVFDQPSTWGSALRVAALNLAAPVMERLGRFDKYQARVHKSELERLIAEVGFDIHNVHYSNLDDMKSLVKTVPDSDRESFARIWLQLEEELNSRFAFELEAEHRGDATNLWLVMPTRTLELRHMPSK